MATLPTYNPLADTFGYSTNLGGSQVQAGFKRNGAGAYMLDPTYNNVNWNWDTAPNELNISGNPLYKTAYSARGDVISNPADYSLGPLLYGYNTTQPQATQVAANTTFDPMDPRTWGSYTGEEPYDWRRNEDYMRSIEDPNYKPIDSGVYNPELPPAAEPPAAEPPSVVEPPPAAEPPPAGQPGTPPPFDYTPVSERPEFAPIEDWQAQAFQFSPEAQAIRERMANANTNVDLGNLMEWSQTPFQFTAEDIENMYAGDFNRLQREQEYGLDELMSTMQERGLSRSGEVLPDPNTPVGRLLETFGQQRSNVVSDVLGKVIPLQEQLSQSRRALGLQGQELTQTGLRTGIDLLSSIGSQDLAAGELDENKLNNAAGRASQALRDALSQGEFELAADYQDFIKQLNSYKVNLESQGQEFSQGLQQSALMGDLVQMALSAGMSDEQIRSMLQQWYGNLLSEITAA